MKTCYECLGVLSCTVLLSMTLQGYGLYADTWIRLDSCEFTRIPLFHCWCEDGKFNSTGTYKNSSLTCLPYGVDPYTLFCDACHALISEPFSYLESFSILCNMFAVCCIAIGICKTACSSSADMDSYTGFAALLYFAAGVLNVAACVVVRERIQSLSFTSLGISYYLNIISGCYTIIQVVLLVIVKTCGENIRPLNPSASIERNTSACLERITSSGTEHISPEFDDSRYSFSERGAVGSPAGV
ncbi:uncharacterized protein LOC110443480 [Mizuhopecten yessoensis]|uniref:uncharacterized protein LOC110443480 n=1 Tax=Mizuhopecten yessoensis TaxID=6573 RepID=UPI000B458A6D|nr:uncharacterized protein LOC110443480 [Mizuhopecten yessoensis]